MVRIEIAERSAAAGEGRIGLLRPCVVQALEEPAELGEVQGRVDRGSGIMDELHTWVRADSDIVERCTDDLLQAALGMLADDAAVFSSLIAGARRATARLHQAGGYINKC